MTRLQTAAVRSAQLKKLLFGVAWLLCAAGVWAQDGAPPLSAKDVGASVIKVESHLVDMTFSVHDAAGKAVAGLQKDDVSVLEDGVAQTVRDFTKQRELPLTVGLIVDASGSQEKFVKEHEKELRAFLRQVLEPRDEAFAVCFGNHLRLVSDTTSSPDAIADGIRRFDKGDRDFPEIGPKEDRELGTALYDAVFYAVTEKLAAVHGRRKALVVFSDGEENSSEHDLIDAIAAAQNGDVLVYALRTTDLHHGKMDARDRYGMRALDHMTAQTGGQSFDVHATDVETDFNAIADDLRNLYELQYQSTHHRRDGGFRKVVIETEKSGLTVRARSGYTAR